MHGLWFLFHPIVEKISLLRCFKCTFLQNKTKNLIPEMRYFLLYIGMHSLCLFFLHTEYRIVCSLKSSRKLEIYSSQCSSHDILFLKTVFCCVPRCKTFVWTEDIIPVKKIGENVFCFKSVIIMHLTAGLLLASASIKEHPGI